MTSIASSGANGLVISDDYIPADAYQAIYHKITKKTERIVKVYKESYIVSYDDICNLNQRFEQSLRHLKTIKSSRCEISHSTKDDYSHTYSSFDKFKISNLEVRECTSSFVYELDFLIVLESDTEDTKNIGQRYKISIAFQQGFVDKDDISVPYFIRNFGQSGKMYLKIDYADYSIAQHLESIVNSWRKGLNEKKTGNLYKTIMIHEESIQNLLPMLTASTSLIGASYYLLNKNEISNSSISILALAIALFYAIRSTIGLATDFAFSNLRQFLPGSLIILTKGDKEKMETISSQNSKSKIILGFILVEVAAAFSIGISSAWIYDRIFN